MEEKDFKDYIVSLHNYEKRKGKKLFRNEVSNII